MDPADQRLYFLVQRAAANLRRVTDAACLAAAGITAAQAAALYAIQAQGRPTQKELAAMLGLGETAITAMAGRLLRAGMIRRDADPGDGRARRLTLTPAGRQALDDLDVVRGRLNARLAEAVGPDAVGPLATALEALAAVTEPDDGAGPALDQPPARSSER